ncbi:MAG: FAD-dependent oxidoreductase [Candidatus Saccharibacteria bacterium]
MKIYLSQALGTFVTFAGKHEESPGVMTFTFKPSAGANWEAGQYYVYMMPGALLDKRTAFRPFTVASSPTEGFLQITTRIPSKPSLVKQNLLNLKVGQKVYTFGPYGFFTLPKTAKEIVMVAGGIGVTPFRSMLAEIGSGACPKITLLYASRDDKPLYTAELDAFSAKHPEFTWHSITEPRHLDAAAIAEYIKTPTGATFLLSGPKPMVKGIAKTLHDELKVPSKQIKHDVFKGYPWPLA